MVFSYKTVLNPKAPEKTSQPIPERLRYLKYSVTDEWFQNRYNRG
jgi:hypothetical protein